MKNINKQQLILSLALVSLFGLSSAYGQNGLEDLFGFENTGGDNVQDAPINFLIPLALLAGAYLGVKKMKK